MHQLVLFDIGNTLIYRDKDLIEFDVELIEMFFRINKKKVIDVIKNKLLVSPGFYDYSLIRMKDLEEERTFTHGFFMSVFKDLKISLEKLDGFIANRESEQRYKVFPRVREMLSELRKRGYILGVASNGRPSRRSVLQQMELMDYFDQDQIYISDEMGVNKPSEGFFEYIEKKSGFTEFVLCDDEIANIVTVSKHGWRTIEMDHNKDVYNEVLSKIIR
ncbi:MAG TPA: HAD family hydrolase [Candidatus Woesebacteria bacterium]|nr:HAD family hydrolase [Candidatus Woesebacteria bacterium]